MLVVFQRDKPGGPQVPTSPAPTSPAERPNTRSDILTIVGVIALVAALFLIPTTRDFIITNLGIVVGAIFHAAAVVGGAIGHAAQAVATFFFGGAA